MAIKTMENSKDWGYKVIDVEKCALPAFNPHPHQRDARQKLNVWPKRRRGLIVLPTGAGKTYTIVHWLLKNVLSGTERRPVLWIAHRAELLQQAAKTFARYTGLVKGREHLSIRCVSGVHGKPVTTLLKTVDVCLVTIQSLSRRQDVVKNISRIIGIVSLLSMKHITVPQKLIRMCFQ